MADDMLFQMQGHRPKDRIKNSISRSEKTISMVAGWFPIALAVIYYAPSKLISNQRMVIRYHVTCIDFNRLYTNFSSNIYI